MQIALTKEKDGDRRGEAARGGETKLKRFGWMY